MHKAHVSKNSEWQIKAFDGLALNELLAREYISARTTWANAPKVAENVMKGIRIIHNS